MAFEDVRNTVIIAAVLTLSSGCLDLELLDNMHPMDTAADADNRKGEGGEPDDATPDSPLPEVDPSDHQPPTVVPLRCGEGERETDGLCIAEGPAGASIRFQTDESAVIRVASDADGESDGTRLVVYSEKWAEVHHVGILSMAETETRVSLEVEDVNGNVDGRDVAVRPTAGVPVAITEILADPLGTEPAQEFVEIANTGEAAVALGGWMIDDNGDADGDYLPEGTVLASGQAAVIAAPDYDIDAPDAPPFYMGGILVLLESSIGSNGLKNAEAESIELYDASGVLVSRFPGGADMPDEGISLVRRHATLPDGDPQAFIPHPNGTATPGSIEETE